VPTLAQPAIDRLAAMAQEATAKRRRVVVVVVVMMSMGSIGESEAERVQRIDRGVPGECVLREEFFMKGSCR
jgi:hypothetical protein